VIILEVGT